MALNYTTYVDQLANLIVIGSTDANFQTFLPGCIDYAEQRIYRELDLLTTTISAATPLSSGVRSIEMPTGSGTFVVVDQINVLTPAGATQSSGIRNPLIRTTREFIDAAYPGAMTNTGLPMFYTMNSQSEAILGPSPDAPYFIEVIGTQRPAPLSTTNSTTYLSQYLPDLFIAASMVFASGYMRDFGAQGVDNPNMAVSWEGQYKTLKDSAETEELRKKFLEDWTQNKPVAAQGG